MTRRFGDPKDWTPPEEGQVKLLLGKAAAQGARALSALVGGTVVPSAWGILPVAGQDPPVGIFAPGQGIYGVTAQVQGDLYGKACLCLSVPNAESLTDRMLQASAVVSSGGDPRVMAWSALMELSNVFTNACLAELSRHLNMELRAASPKLEQGSWDKIWGRVASSQFVVARGRVLFVDCSWSLSQQAARFFLCLSPSSMEELRQWVQRGKEIVTPVGIGALEVADAPVVLKAPDLGSCVAVIMYDSRRKLGGMAHVMLPKSPTPERGREKPGKYGDTAVAALLSRFQPASQKLSVWLAGGADMLIPFVTSIGSIGSKNAEALRSEIRRAGLSLSGEDVGGSQARTVDLLTETGELWIRCGNNQRREFM